MKILIIEDEDGTRFIMGKVAKNEGHEVKMAPDGAAGLALFKEFRPDMVVSDIKMPKMDGLQLLEQIRRLDNNVVVVIISSMDSAEYTLKALRLRANDYFVKPAMEKDLIAIFKKYQDILLSRTKEREIVGMILRKNLEMKVFNQLETVGKVVDRLMQEAEHHIPPADRLGIHLGLVEIITNAIEHGNLEITYDEKSEAMDGDSNAWENLLLTRMGNSPYSDRYVMVELKMDTAHCEWVITDQGPGFDWTKIPDPNDPENLLASHGRGIMLTQFEFDEVTYLGKGNKVRLVKRK
ncbi:MAG: response regulator [Candidatus Riflebacteria bacterium]|nr:response regulator [Candidatus Riflebacteria bacterium]